MAADVIVQIQRERITDGKLQKMDRHEVVDWIHSLEDREAEMADRVERLEAALKRASLLVQLVTVGQVMDAGGRTLEASGLHPYALNEGRADRDDRLNPWWIDAALNETRTEGEG